MIITILNGLLLFSGIYKFVSVADVCFCQLPIMFCFVCVPVRKREFSSNLIHVQRVSDSQWAQSYR